MNTQGTSLTKRKDKRSKQGNDDNEETNGNGHNNETFGDGGMTMNMSKRLWTKTRQVGA